MKNNLPQNTSDVLEFISSSDHASKSKMVLIGGTAMTLQLSHRISEDLDFWLPNEDLLASGIDGLVNELRTKFSVQLVTPHSQIVKAKINGFDLNDVARDYMINGVKVTFMHRDDSAYRQFAEYLKDMTNKHLNIMPLDGIFAMKAYVITKRVKSRDLFDLMTFITGAEDHSLKDIIMLALAASPDATEEMVLSTLIGEIPLDKDDEGLNSVCKTSIEDVYAFFDKQIDLYQKGIARDMILGN